MEIFLSKKLDHFLKTISHLRKDAKYDFISIPTQEQHLYSSDHLSNSPTQNKPLHSSGNLLHFPTQENKLNSYARLSHVPTQDKKLHSSGRLAHNLQFTPEISPSSPSIIPSLSKQISFGNKIEKVAKLTQNSPHTLFHSPTLATHLRMQHLAAKLSNQNEFPNK